MSVMRVHMLSLAALCAVTACALPSLPTSSSSRQDTTVSTPPRPVTNAGGIWRGSIKVVDCWAGASSPNLCEGRRGMTAPLVLTVTQLGFADPRQNLKAEVDVFSPPATGSFIGGFDGSGFFFLEGYVERRQDALGGAVKLRWQHADNRLVVFTIDGRPDDLVDVQLSVRAGSTLATFNEIWQLSTMTR